MNGGAGDFLFVIPGHSAGRAQALSEAERSAAVDQGREQRRRFLTPGTGYQPGNARMFQNNGN